MRYLGAPTLEKTYIAQIEWSRSTILLRADWALNRHFPKIPLTNHV